MAMKPITSRPVRPPAARSCKWPSRKPARSIRLKVRDAIAATDTDTFYGHVKFNADGQINSLQPPVFQLVGGKPVILWPDAIKSGEIRFMPK